MTAAGVLQDHQNMEKQSGCMAGFLQIFDRHQFLAGKRVYATTKRLSPSPATDSASSQSGKPEEEDPKDREFEVQLSPPVCVKPETATPTNVSPKMPLEFKQGLKSSWKFKESPRLSLDSRAIVDAKGSLYPREIRTTSAMLDATSEDENDKQRRSPSVVARLMGLEALPESTTREPFKKQQPELTRCASESRSRDLLRFVDVNNFHYRSEAKVEQKNKSKSDQISPWNQHQHQQQQHKYFDRQDFFPEVKQKESVYGELEKRLKMRGINEGAEDLETLKQILEALQLKGLLHSRRKVEKINNHRNFVYDETPIILTKSCNKTRVATQSPPSNSKTTSIRRNVNLGGSETPLPVRRRQDRSLDDRSPRSGRKFSNSMSPDRSESNARSPCSPAKRKQLSVDTQKRRNESVEHRCNSPVRSPKITPRKNSSDQVSKSPRNNNRRSSLSSTVEICSKERFEDESSSISESSTSTTSHFDIKDYKEGKTLLQRCDKLLNSIAEMATTTESQPSPVSVLDSSFYKDELSPLKRCLDFKDQLEEDHWSPVTSPVRIKSNDADYVYVFEILEASKRISQESNLFNVLEKQRYKNDCNSGSRLHRKLVFDTVAEILNKNKKLPLPPWKGVSCRDTTPFRQVWLEFEKMRERASSSEDMLEVICMALQRDLAEETINGWGECTKEKSEMVLDIERLIFKDMVGEAIQDLATFSGRNRGLVPKKLVF